MHKLYLSVIFFCVSLVAAAQTCDTINFPAPPNWSDTFYEIANGPFPGYISGYINGINASSGGDLQKANYFDLSATSYTHILGTSVKFGKANSTKTLTSQRAFILKYMMMQVVNPAHYSPLHKPHWAK